MNVLKTLTFFRRNTFEIKAEYADEKLLLPMTPKELGTWCIELPPQTEAKKVKVRARLTLHGTFTIEGAQMVEEEEYEEVVKEKRELPPDAAEAAAAPGTDGDAEMKPTDKDAAAEAKDGEANGQEGNSEKPEDGAEKKT